MRSPDTPATIAPPSRSTTTARSTFRGRFDWPAMKATRGHHAQHLLIDRLFERAAVAGATADANLRPTLAVDGRRGRSRRRPGLAGGAARTVCIAIDCFPRRRSIRRRSTRWCGSRISFALLLPVVTEVGRQYLDSTDHAGAGGRAAVERGLDQQSPGDAGVHRTAPRPRAGLRRGTPRDLFDAAGEESGKPAGSVSVGQCGTVTADAFTLDPVPARGRRHRPDWRRRADGALFRRRCPRHARRPDSSRRRRPLGQRRSAGSPRHPASIT